MKNGSNLKKKKLIQPILFFGAVGVGIILLIIVIAAIWIGSEVKTQCQNAKREYVGDCTEALVQLLQDESQGYRARNDAIWALGQLGDRRALPVLESYYTGNIPPQESLDQTISQYELRKAVNLTSGGLNMIAVFWRYGMGNW